MVRTCRPLIVNSLPWRGRVARLDRRHLERRPGASAAIGFGGSGIVHAVSGVRACQRHRLSVRCPCVNVPVDRVAVGGDGLPSKVTPDAGERHTLTSRPCNSNRGWAGIPCGA